MEFVRYDINKYTPRQMITLPLVLLLIAGMVLGYTTLTTGLPLQPGIDFAGGTAVTVFTSDSRETIEATFSGYPLISVGEGIGQREVYPVWAHGRCPVPEPDRAHQREIS